MPSPTAQNDIVLINETQGTPRNMNRDQDFITILRFFDGDLVQVDEIMNEINSVYVGVATIERVIKLNQISLNQEAQSAVFGGAFQCIATGADGSIFATNAVPDDTIKKLDPNTLVTQATSANYGGNIRACTVGMPGVTNTIYIGGATNQTVKQFNQSDLLSAGATSANFGGEIRALATGLDGSIYVAGATTRTVLKLDPVTLVQQQVSTNFGVDNLALAVGNDGSIYVGSSNFVRKLDPLTLVQQAISVDLGTVVRTLTVGLTGFIYVGLSDNTVRRLDPITLVQNAQSATFGGVIRSLATGNRNDIFSGEQTGTVVRRLAPVSLTQQAVSAALGGTAAALTTGSGFLRKRTVLTFTGDDLTKTNTKIFQKDGATRELEFDDNLTFSGGDLANVERVRIP